MSIPTKDRGVCRARRAEGRAGPGRDACPVTNLRCRAVTVRKPTTARGPETDGSLPSCVFCGHLMAVSNTVGGDPIHPDCFTRMCVEALVRKIPVWRWIPYQGWIFRNVDAIDARSGHRAASLVGPEAEVRQIRVSRASQASAPSPGRWAANRSATIESTVHPVPNVARISA